MSYQSKDLSVLAYANGFTLWHYITTDLASTVDTSGYFNDASDLLRVGDMIFANVDTGGTPGGGIYRVAANDAGGVTVADMAAAMAPVATREAA